MALTDRGREFFKGVGSESQKETALSNPRVSNQQQLEQIIKFGPIVHQISTSKALEKEDRITTSKNPRNQNPRSTNASDRSLSKKKHQSSSIQGRDEITTNHLRR